MKATAFPVMFLLAAGAAAGEPPALRTAGKLAAAEARDADPGRLRDAAYPIDSMARTRLAPPGPGHKLVGKESRPEGKRIRIGLRRDVASEKDATGADDALRWRPAPGGGFTARLAVTSPGAEALRIGLALRTLPMGAELRVMGADGRALGPVPAGTLEDHRRASSVYWTPITVGETQAVEIWIPAGTDPASVHVEIDSASHLAVGPSQLMAKGLGQAQACHEDVACTTLHNGAVAKAARSVAKLVFTENGATFLCTGTLVSDGRAGSQVPYLHTAAHCIGTQAAAASLNTFWSFEAASCGSRVPGEYRQLAGGATLLFANRTTDAALLRLGDRAPEGAWFSGWDASPLGEGESVIALHHPAGDLKKLSGGISTKPTESVHGTSYASAAWRFGSTEGGSSGSGLFTLSGGEYVLRGGLRGGTASCGSSGRVDDPANRDYFSRLDLDAAQMAAWLSAAPAPIEDFTGMWWNPQEPGWGLSFMQDERNRVFATLYLYDGDGQPTWLSLPAGEWRASSEFQGKLYRSKGNPVDRAYDPHAFSASEAGMARIRFDAAGATLELDVDGRIVAKRMQRFAE